MSDFARNLRRLRMGKGLTLEELANDLNIRFGTSYNKSMISKWELEQVDPYMATIRNLSIYFDVTLDELLGIRFVNREVSVVDKFIPILGTIHAGMPVLAEQNIIGYSPAPTFAKLKTDNIFYLRVKGDSMNQEFQEGSEVLVDQDAQVESGNIAVVLVNGYDATVKKVRFEGEKIILIPLSTNTEHYAQAYDIVKDEVKIVGKVVGAFKRY